MHATNNVGPNTLTPLILVWFFNFTGLSRATTDRPNVSSQARSIPRKQPGLLREACCGAVSQAMLGHAAIHASKRDPVPRQNAPMRRGLATVRVMFGLIVWCGGTAAGLSAAPVPPAAEDEQPSRAAEASVPQWSPHRRRPNGRDAPRTAQTTPWRPIGQNRGTFSDGDAGGGDRQDIRPLEPEPEPEPGQDGRIVPIPRDAVGRDTQNGSMLPECCPDDLPPCPDSLICPPDVVCPSAPSVAPSIVCPPPPIIYSPPVAAPSTVPAYPTAPAAPVVAPPAYTAPATPVAPPPAPPLLNAPPTNYVTPPPPSLPPPQPATTLPSGHFGLGLCGWLRNHPWLNLGSPPPYAPAGTLDRNRAWLRGEYLLWWTDGNRVPALVTTSTAAVDAGVLGEDTTSVLFGDTDLFTDVRSGGRISGGIWLPRAPDWGIEGSYLVLEKLVDRFAASSAGDPILARPFVNIVTGAEDARPIALSGVAEGDVTVAASSTLQSAEGLIRRVVFERRDAVVPGSVPRTLRVDVVGGYRFARLDEDLLIDDSFEVAGPTMIESFDRFDTQSTFHGGEVGVIGASRRNRWTLEVLLKLAIGNTRAEATLEGLTTTSPGGASPTDPGGLLVLTTNDGSSTRDDLAIIPELGVTLGYDICSGLRATVGYTFLYWSQVARPGEQIDRNVNPTFIPDNGPPAGAPQPEFPFITTDFWAQGLNFGLDYRF